MLDVLATRTHYADHLRPVWDALDPDLRGRFMTKPEPGRAEFVLTASFEDSVQARKMGYSRPASLEHGIGQSYLGVKHGSYAGGWGRADTELFMVPNEHAAARWRAAYPRARVEVVGCPKLDTLPSREPGPGPVVAVSFHWNCSLVPEAGSTFTEYRAAVLALSRQFRVLGHGHPRIIDRIGPWYRDAGIEIVPAFADVCRRADLFIADNTSCLYEFASTGRPVVVLNGRKYRREVAHGLRFWEAASVGLQVSDPVLLTWAAALAVTDSAAQQTAREDALGLVYGIRHGAAEVAAQAVSSWIASRVAVAA